MAQISEKRRHGTSDFLEIHAEGRRPEGPRPKAEALTSSSADGRRPERSSDPLIQKAIAVLANV